MFFIKIPFLDLEKTYSTNLCTGWYRFMEGKYCIVDGENFVTVQQGYKGNFGFSCDEETFYNHWYKYFGVNVDYLQQNYMIRHLGQSFKRAGVRGEGIRIPQQDFRQTLVREVFGDRFDDKTSIAYEEVFRQSFRNKHRNSVRGSGQFIWYSLPLDNKVLLKTYMRTVEVFKDIANKNNKKDIIWCLKVIKAIISDLEWYDFEEMDTTELLDTFLSYGLSFEASQRICIKCFGKYDLFVVDDITEMAVKNVDDWEEYEDANEFVDEVLVGTKYYDVSAYLNELIRWDLLNPPKSGDELLWES